MNQNWWSGYRRYEELILELLRHLNLSPETEVRIKAPDQRWYEADLSEILCAGPEFVVR